MAKPLSRETVSVQPNQTLAKALLLLEAFTEDNPTWGVRELSRHLDTNPTTVYRLASTLMNGGYIEQDPQTRRYKLGSKFLKLANVYTRSNPLAQIARQVFERYSDRFEHNFYLATLNNFEVTYIAALDGRGRIKVVVSAGGTGALHNTALGKVLLAAQDDRYIETFIETIGLKPSTDRTITRPDKLWEAIRETRQKGYAINTGERYREVGAVGVLVRTSPNGPSFAISLAYPQHLVETSDLRVDEILALAQQVARDIEAAYQPYP